MKDRLIFVPLGMLGIASHAASHVVAIAAARSGTTAKWATTGIGLETVSHSVSATTAARPILTPITATRVTLAAREGSMKVISALTTSIIDAVVTTIPMKLSMLLVLQHWVRRSVKASFARKLGAFVMGTPGRGDSSSTRLRLLSRPVGKDVQDHLLAVGLSSR